MEEAEEEAMVTTLEQGLDDRPPCCWPQPSSDQDTEPSLGRRLLPLAPPPPVVVAWSCCW